MKFKGKLPVECVDECRVPAMSKTIPPLVDPLETDEDTSGLVLDRGSILAFNLNLMGSSNKFLGEIPTMYS